MHQGEVVAEGDDFLLTPDQGPVFYETAGSDLENWGRLAREAAKKTKNQVVPQANLANFDPIWGTQYVVRNGAALIWDMIGSGKVAVTVGQTWPLAQALFDSIGPRLTGSERLTKACEWARDKFKSFGIENVPPTGRLILVSNHSGQLPFDGVVKTNEQVFDLLTLGKSLEQTIDQLGFVFRGHTVTAGASAGVAVLGIHAEAGRALEEADSAMYVRKAQRRHEAA